MWGLGVSERDDGLWMDGRVEDRRLGRLLRGSTRCLLAFRAPAIEN